MPFVNIHKFYNLDHLHVDDKASQKDVAIILKRNSSKMNIIIGYLGSKSKIYQNSYFFVTYMFFLFFVNALTAGLPVKKLRRKSQT